MGIAALKDQFLQEFQPPRFGLLQCLPPDNAQGKIGVKFGGNDIGGFLRHMGMHGQPRVPPPAKTVDGPYPRGKAVVRIFGNDPVLNDHALKGDVLLPIA